MKKRKITYSLTARQKKELKNKNESKDNVEGSNNSAEVAVRSKSTRKWIICSLAILLAVVMIFFAVYIIVRASSEIVTKETFINWKTYNPDDPENPSETPNKNPLATITLKGDSASAFKAIFGKEEIKITVEIFMDSAPYAGMNFMYLSEQGFYDGTIISDVNRGHAMFSGFTDVKNSANRAKESNVVRNLSGFGDHNASIWDTENFKLGYRLKAESSRKPAGGYMGYMLMLAGSSNYYSSSTAFFFATAADPQLNFGDENQPINDYLSWLGKANDDESLEYLQKFNNSELMKTIGSGKLYYPETTIRISSIKTNLSKAKKKYLLNNFEELIEGGLTSTWRKVACSDSYYAFEN